MIEISGDRPLSRANQFRYIWIFLKRFPGLFARVPTKRFYPTASLTGSSSLFRRYIDLFLREYIPSVLTKKEVSVFDIGCGSGYIRSILSDLGYHGVYVGLDIVREDRFNTHDVPVFASSFVQEPIETFVSDKKYDVVLSNTSLEHVTDDARAVTRAHELCLPGGIEIHIVPSWWSFFLYLWHGYRHYTYGRIKKIFNGTSYTVYPLGGFFSFVTQFFLVTIPERYGRINIRTSRWYPTIARLAIRFDRFIPFCPIGYAIIVHD